jgi:hypothetical protein
MEEAGRGAPPGEGFHQPERQKRVVDEETAPEGESGRFGGLARDLVQGVALTPRVTEVEGETRVQE